MATYAFTACAQQSTCFASRPASLNRYHAIKSAQSIIRPQYPSAQHIKLQRCRAEGGSGQSQDETETPSLPSSAGPDVTEEAKEKAEPVKGQMTAIVTGALSVVFGILYLALVQLMDSRGADLLPPPPEAFL